MCEVRSTGAGNRPDRSLPAHSRHKAGSRLSWRQLSWCWRQLQAIRGSHSRSLIRSDGKRLEIARPTDNLKTLWEGSGYWLPDLNNRQFSGAWMGLIASRLTPTIVIGCIQLETGRLSGRLREQARSHSLIASIQRETGRLGGRHREQAHSYKGRGVHQEKSGRLSGRLRQQARSHRKAKQRSCPRQSRPTQQ